MGWRCGPRRPWGWPPPPPLRPGCRFTAFLTIDVTSLVTARRLLADAACRGPAWRWPRGAVARHQPPPPPLRPGCRFTAFLTIDVTSLVTALVLVADAACRGPALRAGLQGSGAPQGGAAGRCVSMKRRCPLPPPRPGCSFTSLVTGSVARLVTARRLPVGLPVGASGGGACGFRRQAAHPSRARSHFCSGSYAGGIPSRAA